MVGKTLSLLAVLLPGQLWGQQLIGPVQTPSPSILWQRPAPVLTSSSAIEPVDDGAAPDHRWEGMAIGAGAGALAFGLLGAALCGQSESTNNCTGIVIGTALLGVFTGGITGGLIGGSIPKSQPADSS